MLKCAAAFAAVLLGVAGASAQTFPAKPIKMIVPFAAGGPTDVIARIVAEHMSATLGQPVEIDNIGGLGGTVGITSAMAAAPDGYTIMMGHMGTHGAAPALYTGLKYDPTASAPIGLAASTPVLIVGSKKLPANSLSEFMVYAKANPTNLFQAHAGLGSVSQMACALLDSMLAIAPSTVPYTGTGPAMDDLVRGQVDFMCDQIVNLAEPIRSHSIKAFAIATPERSPALPDVPTTKEAGLAGYQVIAWNAIFAPPGTPVEVTARLNQALRQALADEPTRNRLLGLGAVLPNAEEQSEAWLGAFVKTEVQRWTKALKTASR